MNVVIYGRYSSHGQNDQSIEGQLAECKKFAETNHYKVVDTYIDKAKSGTRDDREQFQKMLKDSEKGLWNGIIVYQLDRFARNRYDSAVHKQKLKKNNVRVMSARENINDDASGILMESVLEGMAEYFSKELSQKVKRGMKINAEKCYYNGGTVPLGYKLIEIDSDTKNANGKVIKKKKFAIDDDTAPIVQKIFKMYLEGQTMAEIIRYCNNQNFKTAFNNEFNKNSIRSILINKRYNGIYFSNKLEIKGGIPQLIDDTTFELVQEKMFTNKKAPSRAKAKAEYLLTTKLFCGHCKDMMTGDSGTGKAKKIYNYYTCKNVKTKPATCNKKSIRKEFIEELVILQAREILTNERIETIANDVVELAKKERNNDNLKRLNKVHKDYESQRDNLFNSLKICDIDSVQKSIFEEIAKMEKQIQGIKEEILIEESQCVKINVSQVKFFLTQIKKGNVKDITYRKLIINILVNKVFLYDDELTIIFNTQDKQYDGRIPNIKDLECSFMGSDALPTYNINKIKT